MPESPAIIILTHNEAENLPRCLESVAGFGEIFVVDSGSNDGTKEIAQRAGARVYEHSFESFARQRNWALANCDVKREWVLFLDADEVATPEFREAVASAIQAAASSIAGFYCCWKIMLDQRWLRRSDSFPKWQLRIVRCGGADFIDSGHGQKEGRVDGELRYVREPYLHYALSKGWEAWWAKHNQYSDEEAADRLSRSVSFDELFSKDSSRRNRALKPILSQVPGWPLLRFLHMYLLKGGFLEGREGFAYCASMGWYEHLIRAKMRERRAHVTEFRKRILMLLVFLISTNYGSTIAKASSDHLQLTVNGVRFTYDLRSVRGDCDTFNRSSIDLKRGGAGNSFHVHERQDSTG